jgi:hypothetical protein
LGLTVIDTSLLTVAEAADRLEDIVRRLIAAPAAG